MSDAQQRDFLKKPEQFSAISEIKKGGGTRRFFREKFNGVPAVFCFYDDAKEENRYYAGIARFLKKINVPAPELFADVPEKNYLVMEDLGEVDLWTLAQENSASLADAYRSALEGVARLHLCPLADFEATGTPIMRDGFNREYYRWECEYFLKNAVEDGLKIGLSREERDALYGDFSELSRLLLDDTFFPRQLVHRDFQSQNILWENGTAHFIDFQGMRVGTGWYDVASLLFDPYVALPSGFRDELFSFYCKKIGTPAGGTSQKRLFIAATQRLMQALGAYFFLSKKMGKPRYRAYVLPALKSLVEVSFCASPHIRSLAQKMLKIEEARTQAASEAMR